MIKTTTLPSPTGADLHVYYTTGRRKPKAIVQINHGLCEHAGRYHEFMQFLKDNDYYAFAHDHRGHGHTKAPNSFAGHFGPSNAGNFVVQDIQTVHNHIREKYGLKTPIICFGHSMGGLLALNYTLKHHNQIKALAIWNTNLKAHKIVPFAKMVLAVEAFFKGSDVPSDIIDGLTFRTWAKSIPNATSKFDWLTHDKDRIEKIENDDLSQMRASISTWRSIFDFTQNGLRKPLPTHLPVHIAGGGQDPATEYGRATKWIYKHFSHQGMTNLTYQFNPNHRHETLNEIGRKDAMDNFINWLDQTLDK